MIMSINKNKEDYGQKIDKESELFVGKWKGNMATVGGFGTYEYTFEFKTDGSCSYSGRPVTNTWEPGISGEGTMWNYNSKTNTLVTDFEGVYNFEILSITKDSWTGRRLGVSVEIVGTFTKVVE